MARVPFVRLFVALVATAALTSALAGQSAPAQAPTADPTPVSAWVPPNPTNAAKIFQWGNKQWGDEFVTPLQSTWQASRPSMIRDQHGMLTLDAPKATGVNVIATLLNHNRQQGRWEARVRSRQYGTGGTPYKLYWELVPRTGGAHCGARDLVLASYSLGSNTAWMHARNLPDLDFAASKSTPLSDNEFHTYAVEITADHISWFVDTKVIRTERRPEAMRAADYAVRFRLQSVPGAQMRQGRMQMDWVRYYTLARPNAKSIEAPQLDQMTYADAC
jgi:beta-glucanase (GH16 family)